MFPHQLLLTYGRDHSEVARGGLDGKAPNQNTTLLLDRWAVQLPAFFPGHKQLQTNNLCNAKWIEPCIRPGRPLTTFNKQRRDIVRSDEVVDMLRTNYSKRDQMQNTRTGRLRSEAS
ncbi:hypothetical protein Bbelb_256860 [Branchiostoma belcheri]|nr:hypothetical protein Bbelb_256860 [Branchiostoma belcheri]